MKILIVCSGNHNSGISTFIQEQVESLIRIGLNVDYFLIKDKGIIGYLKNLIPLVETIKKNNYDLVHAHYGLSGMLSVLQRITPVVITFHGSDIDQNKTRIISLIASRLSRMNIYVHSSQKNKLFEYKNNNLIPCGINLDTFHIIPKNEARKYFNFKDNNYYILFSSSFEGRPEKNYKLAKNAIESLDIDVNLIELKGYSRQEVNILFNAVDMLLVTSLRETGPLVVKEAMAVNCPIVSTDVGDVKDMIKNIEGCYICSFDYLHVAKQIKNTIISGNRVISRNFIKGFEMELTAKKVNQVYNEVLRKVN